MNLLYKFIANPEAVRFLLQGSIKFTPPTELNDPSELTPRVVLDDVSKSLTRLRENGYTEEDMVNLLRQENLLQKLAPKYKLIKLPVTAEQATTIIQSPFYNQLPKLTQILNEMALEVSSKVGLFCLSFRYDSLPMWAHYANNAAGLVVEFTNLDKVFQGDNTGILSQPLAVQYEREQLSITFNTKSHEALFFSKYSDWSYEKEVRVVMPLSDCQKELIGEKYIYIRKVQRSCISRLILGWNMSKEARKTIRANVQELNPEVKIVNARIVHGQVKLEESLCYD
jgi:hypothetical protein